jgi:hypothetical protein
MQSGARSPARVGIDLGEQPVEYSALDRLLDESDKNSFARSQQRSIAPAHQAAGGAACHQLPDAPAHQAAGGTARQALPDAPAHQANAGRRRQSMSGTAEQLAAARARRRSAVERQRVLDSARLAKHVQRQLGARVAEATPASTNGKADSYSLPDDELRPGLAKPSTRANNLHRL